MIIVYINEYGETIKTVNSSPKVPKQVYLGKMIEYALKIDPMGEHRNVVIKHPYALRTRGHPQ